jgi:hypothetical protein
MDKEQLYQEMQPRVQDSKISCRQCFDLAKEFNVSLKIIGEVCNEKGIRIHACQLGCFR